MTITEIQKAFADNGFNFTEAEVEEKLTSAKMTADEVDSEMMAVWLEAMQQQQSKPTKASKTGGLAKGKPAQPPTQAPQQQHPPQAIDLETQQAIANSVNGLQSQVVNYVGQQETQLAEIRNMLGDYNRNLGLRLWGGVAADLQAQGGYDINVSQMMQNSWGNVKADLQSKIDQVNAAAGVRDAA
ncbi:hypothetical protein H6F90_29775 [Trichocoleus sp. FACHB-591]|uniref:hypothetical protein n=1 Tax=Trichocoleus sp. FACHB-591 TaxID=2692872 RepID=UPI001688019D|nr:hypothetical protein [Trichocoleus sp. FACHB-591]MBD2099256.1 hypothetical protein [Trichocoleus sp. FACHB-591]